MSRSLPPLPLRSEPRPRTETTTASLAPRETAMSWDPLRGTDRYRYALVYDDRARSVLAPSVKAE